MALRNAFENLATEAKQLDIKRSVTDFRILLDYDGRSDGNPVYTGKNLQTVLTSASSWAIQKLFYDTSNRVIDAQVLTAFVGPRSLRRRPPAPGMRCASRRSC